MAICYVHDLLRYPDIVVIYQRNIGQRVFGMCIETGTDKYHLRLVLLQRRQPLLRYRMSKISAIAARSQRHVNPLVSDVLAIASRVKRILKR